MTDVYKFNRLDVTSKDFIDINSEIIKTNSDRYEITTSNLNIDGPANISGNTFLHANGNITCTSIQTGNIEASNATLTNSMYLINGQYKWKIEVDVGGNLLFSKWNSNTNQYNLKQKFN